MSDWKILSGRVGLFATADDLRTAAADGFRQAWGQAAAGVQQRPLSPVAARGARGALALACITQPGRIEFEVAADAGDSLEPGPAFVEDVHAYAGCLGEAFAAVRSPGFAAAADRVALRTQLACICADVPAANRAIMPVIRESYRPTLDDEEQFVLQLTNRFPAGRVRGIELSLLVRWSVEDARLTGDGGHASACVLFDIDTAPSGRTFTAEEQFLLLDELRQLTSRANRSLGLNVDGL